MGLNQLWFVAPGARNRIAPLIFLFLTPWKLTRRKVTSKKKKKKTHKDSNKLTNHGHDTCHWTYVFMRPVTNLFVLGMQNGWSYYCFTLVTILHPLQVAPEASVPFDRLVTPLDWTQWRNNVDFESPTTGWSIIIFHTLTWLFRIITCFLLISFQVNTSPSILEYRATIHKGLDTYESPPSGEVSLVNDTLYLNTKDVDGDLNVLFKTSFQTGALPNRPPNRPPYIKKATIGLVDVSVQVYIQGVYRSVYFYRI